MGINLARTGFQEYLEKEEEVLAVYLFGSRSENLAHTRSDIDLAILLRPEVDKSQYTKYRLRYLQELKRFFQLGPAKQAAVGERLRQDEYQRRQSFSKGKRNIKNLDLIILNQVPPLLQFQVLQKGKLLFDRDPDGRAQLEMEMLGKYYDAKRFYNFHFDHLIEQIKKEGLGRGYKGYKSSLKEIR